MKISVTIQLIIIMHEFLFISEFPHFIRYVLYVSYMLGNIDYEQLRFGLTDDFWAWQKMLQSLFKLNRPFSPLLTRNLRCQSKCTIEIRDNRCAFICYTLQLQYKLFDNNKRLNHIRISNNGNCQTEFYPINTVCIYYYTQLCMQVALYCVCCGVLCRPARIWVCWMWILGGKIRMSLYKMHVCISFNERELCSHTFSI